MKWVAVCIDDRFLSACLGLGREANNKKKISWRIPLIVRQCSAVCSSWTCWTSHISSAHMQSCIQHFHMGHRSLLLLLLLLWVSVHNKRRHAAAVSGPVWGSGSVHSARSPLCWRSSGTGPAVCPGGWRCVCPWTAPERCYLTGRAHGNTAAVMTRHLHMTHDAEHAVSHLLHTNIITVFSVCFSANDRAAKQALHTKHDKLSACKV